MAIETHGADDSKIKAPSTESNPEWGQNEQAEDQEEGLVGLVLIKAGSNIS